MFINEQFLMNMFINEQFSMNMFINEQFSVTPLSLDFGESSLEYICLVSPLQKYILLLRIHFQWVLCHLISVSPHRNIYVRWVLYRCTYYYYCTYILVWIYFHQLLLCTRSMTELDFGESSLEYICPVSPLRKYYSYVYIYMIYPVSPPVTWFWWVLVGIYKSGESFTTRYWNTTYIFPVCPQSSSDLLRHNISELPSSPCITNAHPILRCLSERTHWMYVYVVFP